jgi:hypothetical protein
MQGYGDAIGAMLVTALIFWGAVIAAVFTGIGFAIHWLFF